MQTAPFIAENFWKVLNYFLQLKIYVRGRAGESVKQELLIKTIIINISRKFLIKC